MVGKELISLSTSISLPTMEKNSWKDMLLVKLKAVRMKRIIKSPNLLFYYFYKNIKCKTQIMLLILKE